MTNRSTGIILMAGVALVLAVAVYFMFVLPRQNAGSVADQGSEPVVAPTAAGSADTGHINRQVVADGFLISLEIDPQQAAYLPSEGPMLVIPPVEAATPVVPPTESQPLGGAGSEQSGQQAESTLTIPTPIPTIIQQQSVPTAQAAQAPEPIITVDYVVQATDTLYSIARLNATTVSLMAEYGIDSTDVIVGAVLKVPRANPAFCQNKGYRLAYIVREGDTAFSVARTNGLTLAALQQANSLDINYTIYAGQVLCFP